MCKPLPLKSIKSDPALAALIAAKLAAMKAAR